jgi:hypothetical protein
MFVLCSHIRIGNVSFDSVNEVRIKRSIYNLAVTALIKLPVTAVLKQTGEPPANIETAEAIKVGEKVEIRLGYDGSLQTEFVGYVKRLNYKIPLEIECEDEYYKTRFINCAFSKKETTLKQCLNDVLTGIKTNVVADLTLKNFVVNNKPGSWLLGYLKKEYGLTVFFDINGKLYAGKVNGVKGETVKYRLRENVISDDELKYRLAEDIKLKVKAICYYRDGTKVEAETGEEGGEQKTLYYYDVKDAGELKVLATEELKRYSYDGYQGKITTFLFPYCLPGMVARLEDTVYNERSGDYFIESVETDFGAGGARRTVEIGIKA